VGQRGHCRGRGATCPLQTGSDNRASFAGERIPNGDCPPAHKLAKTTGFLSTVRAHHVTVIIAHTHHLCHLQRWVLSLSLPAKMKQLAKRHAAS
jgi:hypothetical protein